MLLLTMVGDGEVWRAKKICGDVDYLHIYLYIWGRCVLLIRAVEMKLVEIREMKVVETKIVEEMKLAEIVKMSGIFVPGHKQRKGDVHPLLLLASNVASPIWHNLLSTIIYSRFDS